MDLILERIERLERALDLAPLVDRFAEETMSQFPGMEVPSGVGRELLEREFEEPETVVLVAHRGDGHPLGACITVPLRDPLIGTALPIVAVLHVDPDLRHRGAAGQLVAEARKVLADRGFAHVAARAPYNDDALISMGERWGFTRQWELMISE